MNGITCPLIVCRIDNYLVLGRIHLDLYMWTLGNTTASSYVSPHSHIHSRLYCTYICLRELPHFQYGATSLCLYSPLIQAPPSGPGLIFAASQVFIWDDPSVTPGPLS